MKYYLLGIVSVLTLLSCGDLKEKKELEKQNKIIKAQQEKMQNTSDSLYYMKAVSFYEKQYLDSAIFAFNILKHSKNYEYQSERYLEKIRTRPWKSYDGIIRESVKGEFSNSATKDSPLWVEVEIQKDSPLGELVYIYLYEYSDNKPSNRSAEKPMYDFSLYVGGDDNGFLCYKIRPRSTFEVGDATHSEGIRLSGKLAKKLINSIRNSNEERLYCSILMGRSSTYNFSLRTFGFDQAYNSLN